MLEEKKHKNPKSDCQELKEFNLLQTQLRWNPVPSNLSQRICHGQRSSLERSTTI